MSYIPKILRVTKFAVQFTCFAHAFNQYVAEVTWVKNEGTFFFSLKTKKIIFLVHWTLHVTQL